MRRQIAGAAAALLVAALTGCKPSSDSAGILIRPPTGPTASLPTLTISAPSTMPPASTAQLHVTAKYADGSSKDVTSTVTWTSSDTSVLTVSNTGLATAGQSGDITILAALDSRSSVIQATRVIPPGTFKLQGSVIWQGNRLGGASVQVTAGTGTGLSAVTDASGAYRLYGVDGAIEVTVSKTSYTTIRQTATITADTTLGFQLASASPLPQFSGTYTFQITADPTCVLSGPQAFPDSARVRRYTATFDVSSTGTGLTGRLSGANFLPDKNLIWGNVLPDGANMDVNHLDYYYGPTFPPPDFAEILADGDVYCPSGSITLSATGQDFVGALNGPLLIRHPPAGTIVSECLSGHHNLSLTRQGGNAASSGIRR